MVSEMYAYVIAGVGMLGGGSIGALWGLWYGRRMR